MAKFELGLFWLTIYISSGYPHHLTCLLYVFIERQFFPFFCSAGFDLPLCSSLLQILEGVVDLPLRMYSVIYFINNSAGSPAVCSVAATCPSCSQVTVCAMLCALRYAVPFRALAKVLFFLRPPSPDPVIQFVAFNVPIQHKLLMNKLYTGWFEAFLGVPGVVWICRHACFFFVCCLCAFFLTWKTPQVGPGPEPPLGVPGLSPGYGKRSFVPLFPPSSTGGSLPPHQVHGILQRVVFQPTPKLRQATDQFLAAHLSGVRNCLTEPLTVLHFFA